MEQCVIFFIHGKEIYKVMANKLTYIKIVEIIFIEAMLY